MLSCEVTVNTCTCIYGLCLQYCIAGNFRGRKLSQIDNFCEENFCGLARLCSTKGRHSPNFAEKTFTNSHKTAKFTKIFSLESFPLYGNCSKRRIWWDMCRLLHEWECNICLKVKSTQEQYWHFCSCNNILVAHA